MVFHTAVSFGHSGRRASAHSTVTRRNGFHSRSIDFYSLSLTRPPVLEPNAQASLSSRHVFAEAVGEAAMQLHVAIDPNRTADRSPVLALECAPVRANDKLLIGQHRGYAGHGEGHCYAGEGLGGLPIQQIESGAERANV